MIINPNNIDKWCFDYFEGNLTSHEQIAFERFILEHPEYHAEFQAWKNASDSDDEKVPVYLGMESLLVGAPFYATFSIRLTVGLLFTFSLGTYVFLQLNQPEKEYSLSNRSVEMNWSPEEHRLAVVRFIDHAYGDYEVKTNVITNVVTHYEYVVNESANNDVEVQESALDIDVIAESEAQNELISENYTDDFFSAEVEQNVLTFQQNGNIANNQINVELAEEAIYKEDHRTLFDHLGIDAEKYGFLDFNNGKVKGLGNGNTSKYKANNNKNDNHATISQNKGKVGKSGGGHSKKNKNFFESLKYLELGFTNINDPLAIVPNNNTIGLNPALAGQLGVTRLKLNARNQWWDTEGSLYRGVVSFDTYIEPIQGGIAYASQYDISADGNRQIAKHSFTYAQKISLSKMANLSVGVTYELSKGKSVGNQSALYEFYVNSPVSALNLNQNWKNDLGVSAWYSGKYFYGGFNVTNLLGNTFTASHEENTSYINQLNYSVQLGTDFKRSILAKSVISPYLQYNKMGELNDLWLGSAVRIRGFVMGGSVATSKSAKVLLGLQGNKMRFTVSSDYSKSMLLDKYALSHELSLRILIGNKNNNWSRYDN